MFAPLLIGVRKEVPMKKTLAAVAALITISSSAFAALPPGVFTSQRPPTASSHRVHVNPSHPVHTPTGNRVRMTPTHGQIGPVGGRMSSTAHRHVGQPPVYRKVGPSPGPHYDHVYVRPSLISYRYYRPLPPPRWRYVGYYGRPYSVWYGYPVAYYGYPYGVYYGRYYATPGVSISVRI